MSASGEHHRHDLPVADANERREKRSDQQRCGHERA